MFRAVAIIVGLGVLAASAHVNIAFTSGYATAHAILTIAVAAGLGIGSLAMGVAWREGRRALVLVLCGTLIAGEMFALLSTTERLVKHREDAQLPALAAIEARAAASARVAAAEVELSKSASSPRLVGAIEAKTAADNAAVGKAAKRGCAIHCRALLEQQVSAAEREIAFARAEVEAKQRTAAAVVSVARASLAALNPAPAATPLANRLGVQGWVLDLIASSLGSIAANGLAGCLIAFGGHRRASRMTTAARAANQPRAPGRVDAFAAAALHPRDGGRVTLGTAYVSYQRWCVGAGLEALPPLDFADSFADLVERLRCPVRVSDGITEVLDVAIEPLALTARA
jgi:hypothetical protein